VPDFPHGTADRALLDMLCDRTNLQGLTLQAHFDNPLVAIGAPADALAPEAARKLGAQVVIPEHAEVANAVGAISGTLTIIAEAQITPADERFVVHAPDERREFTDLTAARQWAGEQVAAALEEKIAGAQVEGFQFHREVRYIDHTGATTIGHPPRIQRRFCHG
jgi:N-methylhydantoinase A/oxoprolinase/acetone carboxylase beta subunit